MTAMKRLNWGGISSAAPATGGGNPFLDFMKSNGGSSLISGILGGIGGIGQARSQERQQQQQNQLTQQQMAAQLQAGGANNIMQDQLQRDMALNQSAPTGWAQGYEQQQLLRNMMLQKLMNGPGIQPTNAAVLDKLKASGWQPFKPTIPEDWQNVNPFGSGQTFEALANRQGVLQNLSGGRAPGLDFAAMGAGDNASRLQQAIGGYQQNAAQNSQNNIDRLMEAVKMSQNPLAQQQQQQQKQGSGFWGKLGKGLAIGGGILATGLTGGAAAPFLGSALSMGGGLLQRLGQRGQQQQPMQELPPNPYNNPYLQNGNTGYNGGMNPQVVRNLQQMMMNQ